MSITLLQRVIVIENSNAFVSILSPLAQEHLLLQDKANANSIRVTSRQTLKLILVLFMASVPKHLLMI